VTDDRPVRILSVDGGGIRGIIPSVMLVALQQRLPAPLSDYFDVIAGTSTGGLIAAGLCAPDAKGAPRYSVEDVLGFYTGDCREIFHRSPLWEVESLDGMSLPKYPADGMEGFLLERFGDLELKDAVRLLVLVTYDLAKRRPMVFSSARAKEDPSRNFLMRDACRATSAAPTFFPPAFVASLGGENREFVDGGVCANDPTLPAFVEADLQFPDRPVLIVSLGTGRLNQPLEGAGTRNWGAAQWALHILDVLTNGQSGMSEACLEHLMATRERAGSSYLRLQPEVPPGLGRMDDTSDENLRGLQEVTRRYCAEQSSRLDSLAAALARARDQSA
jgi:patatin-like phospholipase/acyl hydrolase